MLDYPEYQPRAALFVVPALLFALAILAGRLFGLPGQEAPSQAPVTASSSPRS